jgi:hypothetical protein
MIVNYINPYISNGKVSYDILFVEDGEVLSRLFSSSFNEGFDTSEAVERAIIAASILHPDKTITQVNIDYANGTFNWSNG